MKPSRVLLIYNAIAFTIGVLLTIPVAILVAQQELGYRGAAGMTLCWNVLFVMILPLVLDWSERKHCKVRFLELEEVAKTNPELANAISEQCQKLAIPKLRLAILDSPSDETFSYGLWGHNPRLILPEAFLSAREETVIIPSIEAELTRFTNQDQTMMFLLFTVLQVVLQHTLIAFMTR